MEKSNFYPNQRCVTVHRDEVSKNSRKIFATIYKENIISACCNLRGSTFKVWLYMASNKTGYLLEFSSTYLSKVLNISVQTAKNAFNELKEKGYIVQDETNAHMYDFYEQPHIVEKGIIVKDGLKICIRDGKRIWREFRNEYVDGTYGEPYKMTYDELAYTYGEDGAKYCFDTGEGQPHEW